jgi:hypothetical protein
VAGWAIVRAVVVRAAVVEAVAVTAFATGGCSTGPKDTDVAGSEVATRSNNSKTEQSYVAAEPSNETTSVAVADAHVPGALGSANDDDTPTPDAGVDSFTSTDDAVSADAPVEAGAETTEPDASTGLVPTEASQTTEPSETSTEATCRETAGLCDPVGDCALSDCDFERTGKSCGYTPERTYTFMCVTNADYAPYRPCDADDVCAPGSVCISKATWLKDGSFYRRSATVCRETCRQDADCGENGWCAQATDDNNEVIPDLRVCHRHCSSKADCYVGEGDEDVRCSNSIEDAPPSTDECSRYNPPAAVEPLADATDGVAQSTSDADGAAVGGSEVNALEKLDTGAGLASSLNLHALRVQAGAPECGLDDDCPNDGDCINNTCWTRCDSSTDCGGAECVVVNGGGVCGAPCDKPEGAACGLWPSNCGCSTGETCHLGSDFEPTCAAPGNSGSMEWCNEPDDCDTGLSCIGGLCRPLCDPEDHPCNPVDGECLLSVSREGGDVYACAGSCDPVTAPDCGEGAVCLPGFDGDHHHQALCVAERAAQRPREPNEACSEDYDCATGLGCSAAGTCQAWCRERSDCDPDQTCKFEASIMGHSLGRFGNSVADPIGLCQP